LILISSAHRRLDGHDSFSFTRPTRNRDERRGPHGQRQGALAHYLGHQNLMRLFLRGLGNEVKPFCSPSATETVDGEQTTAARFRRRFAMMKATFCEAPASRMAPAATVATGGPPPSSNSTQEALVGQVDSASLPCNGGSGLVLPRGCRGEVYIRASSYHAMQGFFAGDISILKIESEIC
jgi:hypothetical protein